MTFDQWMDDYLKRAGLRRDVFKPSDIENIQLGWTAGRLNLLDELIEQDRLRTTESA